MTAQFSDWKERLKQSEQAAKTEGQEPPPLSFLDMSKWDHEPVPERKWTISNRVPLNQGGLFSGEGGTGKSIIEMMKDVAHVAGKDWLGSQPELGPAFYLGAEDDTDELHIRLATIAKHYQVTFKQLITGGLHVLCLLGKDATLCATTGKSGRVEVTQLYRQLYERAGDIKPKNISIDTLSRAFAGSEIDRVQVYAFAMHMQAVAMVAGGSVTVLSHPSLSGINSGSGISGSTAWHGHSASGSTSPALSQTKESRPTTILASSNSRKTSTAPRLKRSLCVTTAVSFCRCQGSPRSTSSRKNGRQKTSSSICWAASPGQTASSATSRAATMLQQCSRERTKPSAMLSTTRRSRPPCAGSLKPTRSGTSPPANPHENPSTSHAKFRSYHRKEDRPGAITPIEYSGLQEAFDHFNAALFEGSLPDVFITYQRKAHSFGYFAADRFSGRIDKSGNHELALNPDGFINQTDEQVCQTLVHEMVHVWQHAHGKQAARGYHNKEWAAKMKSIGLQPSSTSMVGGKETGQKMMDYIIADGPFTKTYATLAAAGWKLNLQSAHRPGAKGGTNSKTKLTCSSCGQNAWGKLDLAILCMNCFAEQHPEIAVDYRE